MSGVSGGAARAAPPASAAIDEATMIERYDMHPPPRGSAAGDAGDPTRSPALCSAERGPASLARRAAAQSPAGTSAIENAYALGSFSLTVHDTSPAVPSRVENVTR